MNQYYDKIMALGEAEEFKSTIARWQILSDNIKKYPTDAPVLLPDMLWIAKSGVGKTKLLKLMSEYLAAQKNLMDFYGDVKFFEFLLSYCSPGERFTELQRLMDEVSCAAGFRSEFRGVIHIDINEWIGHQEERHFISFMEYLAANSKNWLIVLTVYSENKAVIHDLTAFLSMYLRMEIISIPLPKTEDLFGYIEDRLGEYGLTLADDGRELLARTIEKIRRSKYFDGFKSIKMLCQDIVYRTYSQPELAVHKLDAAMLAEFSADSEYVNRTVANIEKVNRIGFVTQKGKKDE